DVSNISLNIEFSNEDFSESVLSASDTNIKTPVYIQILTKAISLLTFAGVVYLTYFISKKVNLKKNG
ncbi:MAG: hypothetical protein WAV48_06485, partial [Candidatus Magasanikiibacteriota bacterium]